MEEREEVEPIGHVEDAPVVDSTEVETIGHIEDATEVEAMDHVVEDTSEVVETIGHIEDVNSSLENGVAENTGKPATYLHQSWAKLF